MPRITNAIRTQILDSVLASTNLPKKRDDIMKRTRALAQKIAVSKVPADFKKFSKTQPREWFRIQTEINLGHRNPERGFHDDPAYYAYNSVRLEPFPIPMSHREKFNEDETNLFTPLREEAEALRDGQKTLSVDIRKFLQGCNTTEQILERMPELKPHIPVITKHYPVVVSTDNLLSSLMQVGFKNKSARPTATAGT